MGKDRYDDSTRPRHSHPSPPLENKQSHRTPSFSLGHLVGVQRRAVEEMEEVKEEGEEMDVNDCGGGGLEVVRVLVVDDSPVDRKIVEMLLRRSEGIFDGKIRFYLCSVLIIIGEDVIFMIRNLCSM